ncbi:lipid A deacylase LpxR family protein [uncultured Polaribacter sp.]|uniref:lipid A deacylase LpxR family protein n=1 Tax=uncultured Polaribacter sp. TaxID=174711 RepID=UPI00262265F5|nr:lipid A deacylase LpxR family protein [uncultured Polaribacter sp.]
MIKKLLVFFLLVSSIISAQQKYAKQISVISENDLYTSTYNDRYYTNGFFVSYTYLAKSNPNLEKKIFKWEIGHQMYTPSKSIVLDINGHDRPFAAFFYGDFEIKKVFKNESIFTTNFQLGVIGPTAFGNELQNFIHKIYGFPEAIGWKYQIKNAIGLNLGLAYQKKIFRTSANFLDFTWVNAGNAGTIKTDITTGFLSRIGFKPLQSLANSIAFGTNVNDNTTRFFNTVESFIFIKPTVRYAIYDATIQGSFLNKNSLVTKELIPFVFNFEIGLLFTINRFNLGYTFNYNTNKLDNLEFNNGHTYGAIQLHYLLN